MNRATVTFSAFIFIASLAACEPENTSTPEVVSVAAELSGSTHYDIDLTRLDAVFHVAAGVDVERLSVTCPTLRAMTFADYIERRIDPTGAVYDSSRDTLWLANGAIPRPLVPEVETQPLASKSQALVASRCDVICTDEADGFETCEVRCAQQ
jgi:hypothetical protein